MKISVFVPFGSQSQESGLVYLLANYLKVMYPEVVQLRCNGAFSLCDRDADNSWNRTISSCFNCMSDQKALSNWSGVPVHELSTFLLPDDVSATKRWILSLRPEQLPIAEFQGHPLFKLCRDSFGNRFGMTDPDPANKNHEQFLRKILLAASRMQLAAKRYHLKFAPDLSLVSGSRDYLTASFVAQARLLNRDVAVFDWEVSHRAIRIHHPRSKEILACELVPEGILGMRSDIKTWPRELTDIMGGIVNFLQLEAGQLKLPIAN